METVENVLLSSVLLEMLFVRIEADILLRSHHNILSRRKQVLAVDGQHIRSLCGDLSVKKVVCKSYSNLSMRSIKSPCSFGRIAFADLDESLRGTLVLLV